MQQSLFDTGGPQILLDDDHGRIALTRDFIDAETAHHWFQELHAGIAWKSGRRLMYEREVEVPRLRANFRTDDPALPEVLERALTQVRAAFDAPFDSIGLNLYRDGNDSVAAHNDTLADIAKGQPIVLISLGATRTMTIRAKRPPRRLLRVDLQDASALLMSWNTQLHYDHAIPKQHTPVAPRISLAFRVRGEATG